MVKAYSCSCLNIAALDVPDGETGYLFSGRNPSVVHGCKVSAFQTPHRKKPSPFNCLRVEYNAKLISNTPLTKLAWVCQELFLAPRCVLFGKSELIWSCRENMATESFSETLNANAYYESLPRVCKFVHTCSHRKDASFVGTWDIVVKASSAGNLSFSRDKLVALSSMSEIFSRRFQLTYVAGLRRKS
jgi:hypothetical protein